MTATFNCANTIEATIDSVLGQSYPDFEYIIIDGASSDGTVERIRRHEHNLGHWVSEKDSGIYDAWNKALSASRGHWISFVGGDDQLKHRALEQYADAVRTSPDAEFISSRVQLTRRGQPLRTIGRPWSWPAFSRYMTTAHVGAQHHRRLFNEVGKFNTNYRICGDYELLLRKRGGLRAEFLDLVTAEMSEGGVSEVSAHLALREAEAAKRDIGGRSPFLCRLERYDALIRSYARRAL